MGYGKWTFPVFYVVNLRTQIIQIILYTGQKLWHSSCVMCECYFVLNELGTRYCMNVYPNGLIRCIFVVYHLLYVKTSFFLSGKWGLLFCVIFFRFLFYVCCFFPFLCLFLIFKPNYNG